MMEGGYNHGSGHQPNNFGGTETNNFPAFPTGNFFNNNNLQGTNGQE